MGLDQTHGQAAAPRIPRDRGRPGIARRRELPEPWRDDSQWAEIDSGIAPKGDHRAGRAEAGLAANVGNDAPQPPQLDGSANGVVGYSQHCCGSAGLGRGGRIAHYN